MLVSSTGFLRQSTQTIQGCIDCPPCGILGMSTVGKVSFHTIVRGEDSCENIMLSFRDGKSYTKDNGGIEILADCFGNLYQ
jgi:hypothetical protein